MATYCTRYILDVRKCVYSVYVSGQWQLMVNANAIVNANDIVTVAHKARELTQ